MQPLTIQLDTRKKLVPALRFKEFEGKWAKMKLASVSDKITDGTHFSPQLYERGNYKYISSKNIRNGYMILDDVPYVSDEVHKEIYSRCDVQFNDILLTKDGASTGNVCLNELHEEFSLLSSVAMIRCDAKGSINEYVYQYICSPYGQYEIRSTIAGQAITRITLEKLRGYKFSYPNLQEQQKIASFLSGVDEKIQQLTKKKELLEQYKKGVMQQLFSGQLRFKDENGNSYPDWEEKLLGKLIDICSSKRVLQEDWKEEGVPFLRTREIINLSNNVGFRTPIFITDELFEELKLKYGVPKSGDILATGVGTIGQLYIVNQTDKFYFKDGNVIWFKMNKSLDSNYLNQLFKTRFIRKQLNDNASITTVATFTIDGARKTKILYPCSEEQQKIATYLSSIDTKIDSVTNQIMQTQTFKKGLLQQMFV